ncbi:MAG: coenzyme F420-0:L-glutamate ligase [Nitrososphaerota archaeon]|nr:coenzyme F420-0:L-glutamate ligase [Nitrososphaerota archaeon]MDG6939117.1 coenzyme F420-0:L-glutamate ligase [Nitrososphaerota archaeon]
MELLPVRARRRTEPFALADEMDAALSGSKVALQDGDVLAISGKFIAMARGRLVNLSSVEPLPDAARLASEYGISPGLAEVILRESDFVLKGMNGFILSIKDGAFAPNAGVDKSNVQRGHAILHPSDPSGEARRIREWALLRFGAAIGVVVTDSRLQPLRMGTVGTAIGASGVRTLADDRGRRDLFGNLMKVTRRATADTLASAAQLLMGETSEAVPMVVARDTGVEVGDEFEGLELFVPPAQCIYVKGLSGAPAMPCP